MDLAHLEFFEDVQCTLTFTHRDCVIRKGVRAWVVDYDEAGKTLDLVVAGIRPTPLILGLPARNFEKTT